MMRKMLLVISVATSIAACSSSAVKTGTLAELSDVRADLQDVYLDDSLERAAESYRRYLNETSESAKTPEAMRRMADLQIEQAYGVIGDGEIREMAAPEIADRSADNSGNRPSTNPVAVVESDKEFEQRAMQRAEFFAPTQAVET